MKADIGEGRSLQFLEKFLVLDAAEVLDPVMDVGHVLPGGDQVVWGCNGKCIKYMKLNVVWEVLNYILRFNLWAPQCGVGIIN